jgi:hypothetical protein
MRLAGQQTRERTMTTATRAKVGGEVGINGEFYAGGTFLPNTKLGKMSRSKPTGNRPARTILNPVFGLVAVDNTYAPTFANYGFTRQQVEDIVSRFNAGER